MCHQVTHIIELDKGTKERDFTEIFSLYKKAAEESRLGFHARNALKFIGAILKHSEFEVKGKGEQSEIMGMGIQKNLRQMKDLQQASRFAKQNLEKPWVKDLARVDNAFMELRHTESEAFRELHDAVEKKIREDAKNNKESLLTEEECLRVEHVMQLLFEKAHQRSTGQGR